MPLNLINIRPGFNKQITDTAAEGQYVDGDFVRFRYGLPEKIGGWEKITSKTIVGGIRAQHQWTDLNGRKYVALGSQRGLFIYYEGAFYDITPLETAQTGGTFTTTSGSPIVTCNLIGHNMTAGDLFTFTSVTPPTGAGYSAGDFQDTTFEVTSATINTFTVTMSTNAGASVATNGAFTLNRYIVIGPIGQTYGYGFGTGAWAGGTGVTTNLDGALLADAFGTGGVGTTINVDSTTGFTTTGVIKVDNELISYTGITSTSLTGIVRAVNGTSTASHADGEGIELFTAWGAASLSSSVTLDPADWSLDNFGQILTATILNGRTFVWQPLNYNLNALETRATIMSGAPTKTNTSIVSDQDRHFIHLGTESTIGDNSSFDPMFIRFSNQENYNEYQPTSVNTAGTFRIDDGTNIIGSVKGKDYILVLTDTAAYTVQYVGAPFTFSIRKVGSNCGLISPKAMVFVDGVVYWMDDAGGFNAFNGTVQKIPCPVEDYVFSTTNPGDLGINFNSGRLVYAGVNTLFNEINWFYPTASADEIDRCVTYNYEDKVWYTSSLARTSYYDAHLFDNPYASSFNSSGVPSFPTIQGVTNLSGNSTFWAHEIGVDQLADGATTTITSFIESGDFQLHVDGDGETFTKIRRFIPDFQRLTGTATVTILLKDYPSDTAVSSALGPFSVTSSTQKIDTRARGRAAALKIQTTATGETWRYGTFRADIQPDGKR
jgi:hypothetical protein